MTDDATPLEAPDAPSSQETTAEVVPQPNTAARAAIAGAVAKRGAATKRPPRNEPVKLEAPAIEAVAPVATVAPDAPAKKKKPSGKKKTRAELAALVKQYERDRKAGTTLEVAPAAGDPAAAAPAASTSLVVGDPIAKEKFAKGVARFAGAVSRFVARRRGAHWMFQPDECEALGDSAADCLEAGEEMAPSLTPWLQTGMKLAPFVMFAGVAYEIIDSRLETDEKIGSGAAPKVLPGDAPMRIVP